MIRVLLLVALLASVWCNEKKGALLTNFKFKKHDEPSVYDLHGAALYPGRTKLVASERKGDSEFQRILALGEIAKKRRDSEIN